MTKLKVLINDLNQSGGGGGATSSDNVSNDSGVSGANVTEALDNLQQQIPNPNNLVNQFTTDTQGVSGRFTVQTPIDTNTSDAASVGYVLSKLGNPSEITPFTTSLPFEETSTYTIGVYNKNMNMLLHSYRYILHRDQFCRHH